MHLFARRVDQFCCCGRSSLGRVLGGGGGGGGDSLLLLCCRSCSCFGSCCCCSPSFELCQDNARCRHAVVVTRCISLNGPCCLRKQKCKKVLFLGKMTQAVDHRMQKLTTVLITRCTLSCGVVCSVPTFFSEAVSLLIGPRQCQSMLQLGNLHSMQAVARFASPICINLCITWLSC